MIALLIITLIVVSLCWKRPNDMPLSEKYRQEVMKCDC